MIFDLCQTTMPTMVGRITNQFAAREKVSQKCGAEPMEQCVTLVSYAACCWISLLKNLSRVWIFLSKSKVLRFLEKNSHWSNGTCDSGEFLSPAGQIDPRIVPKSWQIGREIHKLRDGLALCLASPPLHTKHLEFTCSLGVKTKTKMETRTFTKSKTKTKCLS